MKYRKYLLNIKQILKKLHFESCIPHVKIQELLFLRELGTNFFYFTQYGLREQLYMALLFLFLGETTIGVSYV